MPTPKLFKNSPSESNNSSESSSAPDVPANANHGASQNLTATPAGPVPEYSDSLKEAWTVAHPELPQVQGAEKLLNKIGMSNKT